MLPALNADSSALIPGTIYATTAETNLPDSTNLPDLNIKRRKIKELELLGLCIVCEQPVCVDVENNLRLLHFCAEHDIAWGASGAWLLATERDPLLGLYTFANRMRKVLYTLQCLCGNRRMADDYLCGQCRMDLTPTL